MTCIKTGARVYFEDYGQTLPADLFRVGDCIIIRTHPEALRRGDGLPEEDEVKSHTHTVSSDCRNELWRDDIGIFVVTEDRVTGELSE